MTPEYDYFLLDRYVSRGEWDDKWRARCSMNTDLQLPSQLLAPKVQEVDGRQVYLFDIKDKTCAFSNSSETPLTLFGVPCLTLDQALAHKEASERSFAISLKHD